MATTEEWTPEQLRDRLVKDSQPELTFALVNKWLERGDTVAVYENADLGHPRAGAIQLTSYGSAKAMLERTQFPDGPPEIMPDTDQTNWRYRLKAVVREGPVPVPGVLTERDRTCTKEGCMAYFEPSVVGSTDDGHPGMSTGWCWNKERDDVGDVVVHAHRVRPEIREQVRAMFPEDVRAWFQDF